jgi:hypothetical protein
MCPNLVAKISYGNVDEMMYRTGATNDSEASPELHGEARRWRCFELGLGRRAREGLRVNQGRRCLEGYIYIARRRNCFLWNLRPKSTGCSTFNGWDHDREIVGMCQPFPAKFSETKQKAEGFEVGQAPKQISVQNWFHSRWRTPDWNLLRIKLHVYDGQHRLDEKEWRENRVRIKTLSQTRENTKSMSSEWVDIRTKHKHNEI